MAKIITWNNYKKTITELEPWEKEALELLAKLDHKVQIVKEEEGGYIFSIPELKGCLTAADSIEEGMELLEDAKKAWIHAAIESNYKYKEKP